MTPPAPTRDGTTETPPVAHEVVGIVREVLGEALVGAYLHGSAVLGGLRPTSDVDVLAVIERPTTPDERRLLVERLMDISGRRARRGPGRPIELTILVSADLNPWPNPPDVDFLYGEWRRDAYERGFVPAPGPMPDLGPEIAIALAGNRTLFGPPPGALFDPVPPAELRRSVLAGIESLVDDLDTDTRNVLLTFARIWQTVVTGEIGSKDDAAAWAVARLGEDHRAPLETARTMYLEGWDRDDWGDDLPAARATAARLVDEIRAAARDA
jgi:predicted nucleotidyltransferase